MSNREHARTTSFCIYLFVSGGGYHCVKVNADFVLVLLKLYSLQFFFFRTLKLLVSAQLHEFVNTPFVSVSNSAKTKVMCAVQIVGFVHPQSCFMHMCVFSHVSL